MAGPSDIPEVLLERAADDELAARSLLPVEGLTDAPIGFHAQQAVEKSIKAVLAQNGTEYPYSHDLEGLIELCEEQGIEVPPELSGVNALTVFGVRLRYGSTSPARLDRDKALQWATDAVAWARAVIDAAGAESGEPAPPDRAQSPPDRD